MDRTEKQYAGRNDCQSASTGGVMVVVQGAAYRFEVLEVIVNGTEADQAHLGPNGVDTSPRPRAAQC